MKQLYIQLETLSPLAVRTTYASRGAGTTGYVVGNTLLGSLAAAHRFWLPAKKEEFGELFLRGRILYPNLYPAVVDTTFDAWQNMYLPVYPIPKTAQTCKRYGGFLYPELEGNARHGVRDTLIDWALFKLSAQVDIQENDFEPWSAFLKYRRCIFCGEPMDCFHGYYRRDEASNRMLATTAHAARLQTHIKVDRESGTTRGGALYSRQVFDEGTKFWGALKLVDDSLASLLKDFINQVSSAGLVRVGSDRTRGMGKVRIEVVESREAVQERLATFVVRLQSFNIVLVENLAQWGLKSFQRNYFFSVTLHSPLILNDDFLRYRSTIDADILRELLGVPWEGLEQVYQNASMKRVMGWQELWGTPRMNEYAIDTGSVFLFQSATLPDQSVLDALFRLEEQGAGKRRAEGFGCLRISDPFHKEIVPR
ncbi:MAG: hypothetical protein NVS4B12_08710 [Ktedonobacteraceae bacterium]